MKARTQKEFFDSRRRKGEPLALVTVYETGGSTYSKAGARMLVDEQGRFHGMLSGGCLEGDLAMRARVAIESGQVQYASYDLGADDDELWGMGVGCDGEMRVILQPLDASTGYEPYARMSSIELGEQPAVLALVVESESASTPAGATMIMAGDDIDNFGFDQTALSEIANDIRADRLPPGETMVQRNISGAPVRLMCQRLLPLPRLLVLGAGLDAEPVVRLASELGWQCTVADHRPAYIEGNDFSSAVRTLCTPAADAGKSIDFDRFDLAIVMSHHLVSDRAYLTQLATSRIPYVGLLGPGSRRDRLMRQLGDDAGLLDGRLHGPAGLDLGGRGPAAIALSILAEMQQHLSNNWGQ